MLQYDIAELLEGFVFNLEISEIRGVFVRLTLERSNCSLRAKTNLGKVKLLAESEDQPWHLTRFRTILSSNRLTVD